MSITQAVHLRLDRGGQESRPRDHPRQPEEVQHRLRDPDALREAEAARSSQLYSALPQQALRRAAWCGQLQQRLQVRRSLPAGHPHHALHPPHGPQPRQPNERERSQEPRRLAQPRVPTGDS